MRLRTRLKLGERDTGRTSSLFGFSSEESRVQPSSEAHLLHKPVFIAFLLSFATGWVFLILKIETSKSPPWVEAIVLLCAAATLLVGLARRLPVQNVCMSAISIAAISSLTILTGARTGIPFGAFIYTDRIGGLIFGTLPWPVPLLWIVAILSSRGVARLIVRPWRKTNFYGFWVIGLTVLLVLTVDLSMEPYASAWKRYWIWKTPASVPDWYGAPWANFLGWGLTVLAILVLTTPWLINKQPLKQPADYHPLIIWFLFNLYLATANASHGYPWAAGLGAAISVGATVLAIRGGRW
ncbi:MAG: carotenoid biosynthesis protein [Pedosphaera sp.]|nr:carotenoid biosynthesis protein [Pedosphaera sp.]